MSDEKDVIIKISYIEDSTQLNEFLGLVEEIGLLPEGIRKKELPSKPKAIGGSSTKDVMIAVAGDSDTANDIVTEFLEKVERELELLPASRNEKLLGGD